MEKTLNSLFMFLYKSASWNSTLIVLIKHVSMRPLSEGDTWTLVMRIITLPHDCSVQFRDLILWQQKGSSLLVEIKTTTCSFSQSGVLNSTDERRFVIYFRRGVRFDFHFHFLFKLDTRPKGTMDYNLFMVITIRKRRTRSIYILWTGILELSKRTH